MPRISPAPGTFFDIYGEHWVRAEGERLSRVRFHPGRAHSNASGAAHGGYLMSIADTSIFAGPLAHGIDVTAGSTIDLAIQLMAPVPVDRPVDVVVEVMRETGRLLFVRGVIEQDGPALASFTATVRKPGAGR